jgi:hypothetical protein
LHWFERVPFWKSCEQLAVTAPSVTVETAKPMTNVSMDGAPTALLPLFQSSAAVFCGSLYGHMPAGEPVFEQSGCMSRFGAPSVSRMMYSDRQPPCT